jgi:hypothetical protein
LASVKDRPSDAAWEKSTVSHESSSQKEPEAVYGFRPFPARGGIVTNELIDEIPDDDMEVAKF